MGADKLTKISLVFYRTYLTNCEHIYPKIVQLKVLPIEGSPSGLIADSPFISLANGLAIFSQNIRYVS